MTRIEVEVSTVRKSFLEIFKALLDIIGRCEKCDVTNAHARELLRTALDTQEHVTDHIRKKLSEE